MLQTSRQISHSHKEFACNAGDSGSIPGLGRSHGEGNGNPLQYSCLGNPMDREAWHAIVHGVAKSQTPLSNWTHNGKRWTYLLPSNSIPSGGSGKLLHMWLEETTLPQSKRVCAHRARGREIQEQNEERPTGLHALYGKLIYGNSGK